MHICIAYSLVNGVRRADRLRNAPLPEDVIEPGNEPIVRPQVPTAGAVEYVRSWTSHGFRVLDVHACLSIRVARVVPLVLNLFDLGGRIRRVEAVFAPHKCYQVRWARIVP